jgi:hypothetical protein
VLSKVVEVQHEDHLLRKLATMRSLRDFCPGGIFDFFDSIDPTRISSGNFAVTHKTLPFGDVLECLLDLREDL